MDFECASSEKYLYTVLFLNISIGKNAINTFAVCIIESI